MSNNLPSQQTYQSINEALRKVYLSEEKNTLNENKEKALSLFNNVKEKFVDNGIKIIEENETENGKFSVYFSLMHSDFNSKHETREKKFKFVRSLLNELGLKKVGGFENYYFKKWNNTDGNNYWLLTVDLLVETLVDDSVEERVILALGLYDKLV